MLCAMIERVCSGIQWLEMIHPCKGEVFFRTVESILIVGHPRSRSAHKHGLAGDGGRDQIGLVGEEARGRW
jgi:hypothetical protein